MDSKVKHLAKRTRFYRKFHKYIAVPMLAFMFLLGVTGLLLAWKSELKLSPPSKKVSQVNQPTIALSKIQENAIRFVKNLNLDTTINRIDYRPSKGIAKVRFEHHFTELQINCYTGELLSNKQRTADIIEMIHDGSILDYLFKNKSDNIKLVYSTITSLALILLAFSGFWLWLKPRQIRAHKTVKHKRNL